MALPCFITVMAVQSSVPICAQAGTVWPTPGPVSGISGLPYTRVDHAPTLAATHPDFHNIRTCCLQAELQVPRVAGSSVAQSSVHSTRLFRNSVAAPVPIMSQGEGQC